MSWERDDKWLRDIYIPYIDMLANLLEKNLLKAIVSVTDLDQKCLFVLQASGIIRSSMVSLVSLAPDCSPVITLFASMLLCGLKQDSDAYQG